MNVHYPEDINVSGSIRFCVARKPLWNSDMLSETPYPVVLVSDTDWEVEASAAGETDGAVSIATGTVVEVSATLVVIEITEVSSCPPPRSIIVVDPITTTTSGTPEMGMLIKGAVDASATKALAELP